ncbi:unnamed protein product [Tuber melanosporum]|uniref:(Perigord truffle) hypothetical protein n=1 Tax=Tuber melanosporum (strain Mel28) TaxID=656061 RepID=D5G7B1_TUBMM|nr:uncharacterized protein GSTUM_00002421001 [Tuber melanosporum]CAZ80404.1 unnamed protein product [Tuber melanosporum]
MVSSQGSYTATDLSRRTENTSYSIPEDGHPVTIQTSRKKKKDHEVTSAVSTVGHGTNASLLIEYFESGKASTSGRRPSVRVKLTPAAKKRHNFKASPDGQGLQISDVGSRPGSRQDRRPSHTQRVSLSPHVGEDRMIMGEPNHNRSLSGDQTSVISSQTSNADDSNLSHYPLNVTVIREAGSPRSTYSSPREMEETEIAFRTRRRPNKSGTRSHTEGYQKDVLKSAQKGRSRSVSREIDVAGEAGLKTAKLGRRRSRSLSKERLSMSKEEKQMIEQGVMEGLEKLRLPKQGKQGSRGGGKADADLLKAPRMRSRSRSRDREVDEIAAEKLRQKRKASTDAERKRSASNVTNPALLELVEDAIKRMILPQLNELKSAQNQAKFEQSLSPTSTLDRQGSTKRPDKTRSMPDVKPMVVLSPDIDQGNGQGVVISGGGRDGDNQEVIDQFIDKILVIAGGNADLLSQKSEASYPRGPGFGGVSPSVHSVEDGEGVSLVGAVPARGNRERLEMPDHPDRLDTPGTYAETRASILSANSGLPYPNQNGMPASGNTPPPVPKSEFPVFSELNLRSRASSIVSERTGLDDHRSNASKRSLAGERGINEPSIVSFAPVGDEEDGRDDISSVSSGSRRSIGSPTTLAPGDAAVSILSMSSTQSTKLAKQRRKGKGKGGEMSGINEADYHETSGGNQVVNDYFAQVREMAQSKALQEPRMHDTSIEARHVSTFTGNDFDDSHMEKFDGQQVFSLGANPSMRSTPVVADSVQPSVLDAPSNVGSNLSHRQSPLPQLAASALPEFDDPMPEYGRMAEDDEEINTNPSIIQGPGREPEDWRFDPPAQSANELHLGGDRGMGADDNLPPSLRAGQGMSPTSPALKDEGYISAANPGMASPSPMTPVQNVGDPSMGMGAIRGTGSEDDNYSYHGHARMASGNSHGMPSPLYDSSTGRGIDRIQSRDIVALMDHLTVRDAQRNARDTEILVTLVRSAAEMRNSFEDMKKTLESQQHAIIDGVDQNTERSVQKVLQGPRPLPPSAPRAPRYPKNDDDAEDEGPAKRRNVFRRALKGLSMRSSNDLQRIEEMLQTLLGEVEGLKGGQNFYQQSLLQSQSMGTFDAMKSVTEGQDTNPNSSGGNSGYCSGAPSKQPSSSRIYQDERPHQPTRISPIEEDTALRTPPRSRGGSIPLETPPDARAPPTAFSNENTPTKSEKHQKRESNSSSLNPKNKSRWSETTASSGFRAMFGRGNRGESRSDVDLYDPSIPKDMQQGSAYSEEPAERAHSPHPPPSSRDTDAPINHSNRRSLEVHHPQPRIPYNHQLEAQAQQLLANGVIPNSPGMNASTSSLGTLPPLGPGGFSNGKLVSPLARDAYDQHRQQLQQQQQSPKGPSIPPRVKEDPITPAPTGDDPSVTSRSDRKKKHRERDENGKKPKRTEEEKAARRERKERKAREREAAGLDSVSSTSRKKSRDQLSLDGATGRHGDVVSPLSARSPSIQSRLNGPRPLSSNSNKENTRRHRHQGSQGTVDTFGNPEYDNYGSYR